MGATSQQGALAKKVSLSQYGDDFGFGALLRCLQDLDLALFDHTEHPSRLSLPVNEISRPEVGAIEILRRVGIEETEIARKKQVPKPVQGDFDSARPRRQLKEINTTPQKPGEKTRDAHAKHFRHRLVTANRAKLAKCLEAERLRGFAFENADEIEGRLATLALRELGCGWRGLVVERVDNVGAITNCPSARLSFNSHVGGRAYAATLLRHVERLNDGRRC